MNNSLIRNRNIAMTAAFAALIIVLGIANIGMIPIGAVASITILQIPVILIVMLTAGDKFINGLWEGLIVGLAFGIYSLVKAAMSPSGVLDPLFVNPLCSVLPRLLLGVVAWLLWKLIGLIPHMPKIVNAAVTAFVSTIAHTLLVIGCLYIFKGADIRAAMGGIGYWALIGALMFNAVLEALSSTIVCTAVMAGITISKNKKSKLTSSAAGDSNKETDKNN